MNNMRKLISLLIMSFVCIFVYSQISFSDVKKNDEILYLNNKYDSLQNFNEENVLLQKGQLLYCYHCNCETMFKKDGTIFNPKKRIDVYGNERIETDSSSINNRYFYVYDVIDNSNGRAPKYLLTLIEKNKKDTIYWNFKPNDYLIPIFMNVGYYEKIRSRYVGQKYYMYNSFYSKGLKEKFGKFIPEGTIFKCVDITLDRNLTDWFYAILYNSKYGKIEEHIDLEEKNGFTMFCSIRYLNKCIKRFGRYYGKLVAEGVAVEGMTKRMILEIYGYPNDKNITTTNGNRYEQWIYIRDNERNVREYIYIENDKVTGFQN